MRSIPDPDRDGRDPSAVRASDDRAARRADRSFDETSRAERLERIGGCGAADTELRPKYVLPFPEGATFPLTQGNCGEASHDGRFSYAFDFGMPMGTPVTAARDGVVFALRADRPDGSGVIGDENYLFIRHEDGEISRYIHLGRAGVLVRQGDRVSRGDTVALSGNSGRSAFPHLHFDVAVGCEGGPCVTIGAAFLNAEPPIPTALGAYTAGSEASAR